MVPARARLDQRSASEGVPGRGADFFRTKARRMDGGAFSIAQLGIEAGPRRERDRMVAGATRFRGGRRNRAPRYRAGSPAAGGSQSGRRRALNRTGRFG